MVGVVWLQHCGFDEFDLFFWQRLVLFGEIAISPSDRNNCDIHRLLARAADIFVKRGAFIRNLGIPLHSVHHLIGQLTILSFIKIIKEYMVFSQTMTLFKDKTKTSQNNDENKHIDCNYNMMEVHEDRLTGKEKFTNPVYSSSSHTSPPGPTPPRSEVCG